MELNTMNTLLQTAVTALGTLGGWEALRYLTNRKSNIRIARAQADEAQLSTLRLTMDFLQTEIQRQTEHITRQNVEIRRLNEDIIALTRRIGELDNKLQLTRCDTPNCPLRTVNAPTPTNPSAYETTN